MIGWSGVVHARCSRPINVPLSPVGIYVTVGEKGTPGGIDMAVMDVIARKTQCRFNFIRVPRIRAWKMFMSGEADLMMAAIRSAERDEAGELVVFSRPIVAAIGLRSQRDVLAPDSQLSGSFPVNIVRGYEYGEQYAGLVSVLDNQQRLETVVDPDTAAKKLAAGRAGVILISPLAMTEAILQYVTEEIFVLPLMSAPDEGFYLSRRSLNAQDRALLKAAFSDKEAHRTFAGAFHNRVPAWAAVGVQLVE
ncbi:transporter substrate-binding domain-containing protein [Andreprevotia sp. IGB-42]|uniref:transporter substrate-binding domain-containing protein n=1 Tax=Andreprevotia sp. IGB-42 TaxID=2497473 RepID=UPI00135B0EFD|nr:transporter substrate-binding domain-containing protein [Andreprevotia sp. IGB-42]